MDRSIRLTNNLSRSLPDPVLRARLAAHRTDPLTMRRARDRALGHSPGLIDRGSAEHLGPAKESRT